MENSKKETKRILIYLGITFFITYAYSFFVVYPASGTKNIQEGMNGLTSLLIAGMMFFPALGVFITRLVTKEGFKNAMLWPRFKGNLKIYLLAYFGPSLLAVLGAALYFLIFPNELDLELGYMQTMLKTTAGGEQMQDIPLSVVLISQTVTAFFFGPIMNFFFCFGEEWGWRGYLLPKMSKKFSAVPCLLITGVIWGVWHAPMTAIGHNYGVGYPGFPYVGIASMCGFCIVMGVFFSYLTLKTNSCIPAILAHGAINSSGAIGMYLTKNGPNSFLGPIPTGIIGGLPFIVLAVVLLVFYFGKGEKK